MSTGEIAEVADADKAPGQHMLAKAAQELGPGESHDALLIAVSIVFPSKAHGVTIEAEQGVPAVPLRNATVPLIFVIRLLVLQF